MMVDAIMSSPVCHRVKRVVHVVEAADRRQAVGGGRQAGGEAHEGGGGGRAQREPRAVAHAPQRQEAAQRGAEQQQLVHPVCGGA